MKHDNFSNTLTKWYLANQRTLPWRNTGDPYAIWVSEIILQQTRINQGLDYYHRFISRFPDIQTLANASEENVLKTWEGLGYYSRARNMHATARILTEKFGGKFPEDPKELEKLKGIGKYTAAAIASIAFGKPAAVVDGNVIRFITRFFGIEEPIDNSRTLKQIHRLADELIIEDSPGLFNQAMMEFGALQCVPANPDCLFCPFMESCSAYKKGKVATIPFKAKKTEQSARYFNYMVVQTSRNGSPAQLIRKRSDKDIWKHLYDFPLIEADKLFEQQQLVGHDVYKSMFASCEPKVEVYDGTYRHLLTHRIIFARFFKISVSENDRISYPEDLIFADDLSRYPLPKLIKNFLNDHKTLPESI